MNTQNEAPKMQSDKLNIVDAATFLRMRDGAAAPQSVVKPFNIRNAKYRNRHRGGNAIGPVTLATYLAAKPKRQRVRRIRWRQGTGRSRPFKSTKGTGKKPVTGKKKRPSRLKKSILRYRRMMRQKTAENPEPSMTELAAAMADISISPTPAEASAPATNPALPQTEAMEVEFDSVAIMKAAVHSNRFRSYCDNFTTPQLNTLVEHLLRTLNRFQRRAYAQNPFKAIAHRRFVVGFREVQNYLEVNKIQLVVIAPDCEKCEGEGGLDEVVESMKAKCQETKTPYIFSLQRRHLSFALYKKTPVSCVGILNYDGVRVVFEQLLMEMEETKNAYKMATTPRPRPRPGDFF